MTSNESQFVSRAGVKLSAALDRFGVGPTGMICADLGANVGGFTDCLLQRGAAKVFAVETGYGVLEYKLRKDPRVVVMERVNALHVKLPELCDLVVIDLGWTQQKRILPHAREMLKAGGKIISLVKPHYEAQKNLLKAGVLRPEDSEAVYQQVVKEIPNWGFRVADAMESPLVGAKGNREYLILLEKV
jgi:23S rRNA (cytidine1920-2'-O)/16S rRNA (cytidine1409-2'-O)-methyltransferase